MLPSPSKNSNKRPPTSWRDPGLLGLRVYRTHRSRSRISAAQKRNIGAPLNEGAVIHTPKKSASRCHARAQREVAEVVSFQPSPMPLMLPAAKGFARASRLPNFLLVNGLCPLDLRFTMCAPTCTKVQRLPAHFATRSVAAGIDLPTLSAILGHKSMRMTMRYVHPAEEHKRFAAGKLETFRQAGILQAIEKRAQAATISATVQRER